MSKRRFDNPFHDLWVTEILDSNAFVKLFSGVLLNESEALFSTGNIVLKGRQGSGKSMLLRLLDTSTRLAYRNSSISYPVPKKQRKFISADINLIRDSFSLISSRASEIPENKRNKTLALIFSDYFNLLLCLDLLKNIDFLTKAQKEDKNFLPEVPIDFTLKTQSKLLNLLLKTDSWPDILQNDCSSIDDITNILDERRRIYLRYFNYNIEEFPEKITRTRSTAGALIAELAESLRLANILPEETLIILRIDQHEELYELERKGEFGNIFRKVLNSVLAHRDPRVAYRVGTRHYAWEDIKTCWGSDAPLELERDYSEIDLDEMLRRRESASNWVFPRLAIDVVKKRVAFAGFQNEEEPIKKMFGKSLFPKDKAKIYAGKSDSIIKTEDSWAPEWKQYLESLWIKGDPLDAKFGEVWLRQSKQQKEKVHENGSLAKGFPWRKSPWWIKERNEIALMQIAGDRQQAMIWSGERQIINLAGDNILAFMLICKTIWSTWQRRTPLNIENHEKTIPEFSVDDQKIGIMEASQRWFSKINVGTEANKRIAFTRALGSWFRRKMLSDRSLSYPGHNGFSLTYSDFVLDCELIELIKHCRDHGDLLQSDHTTKSKNQERRYKWYLHPLFCPTFRIPHIRTKEPIYISIDDLKDIYNPCSQQIKDGSLNQQENQNTEISKKNDKSQLKLPGVE